MQSGANKPEFRHPAHDPFFWLKQAQQLDTAAMLIWSGMKGNFEAMQQTPVGKTLSQSDIPYASLGGVFWLNAGFALENLFKGLIVQADPTCIANGTITKDLKTHNLSRLAKRAAIDLNVTDAFFLWIGTECIIWAGRYPCSTKPGDAPPPLFSEADVIAYRRLFDRLASRFDRANCKAITYTRLT